MSSSTRIRLTACGAVLLAVLIGGGIWWARPREVKTANESKQLRSGSQATESRANAPVLKDDHLPTGSNSNVAASDIAVLKNKDVEFFGKVVDESDRPLSGVHVVAHVRHWRTFAPRQFGAEFKRMEARSDAQGRFLLAGASGDVLKIESLTKPGYEAEPAALRNFGVNISENVSTTTESPFILRMWTVGVEGIGGVTFDRSLRLIPDGREYFLDLVTGAWSEGSVGDLKLSIVRPPEVRLGERFDWTCKLEMVNGGLKQVADSFRSMTIAPADGYMPRVDVEQRASADQWSSAAANQNFFFSARNRFYGKAALRISPRYNEEPTGRIRIQWILNTNGTRFLR